MKIEVSVQANSGKQAIKKLSEDQYKIYLKKPAEDNKANIELLKLLKKYFKKEIKIIHGRNSKKKIIEIN